MRYLSILLTSLSLLLGSTFGLAQTSDLYAIIEVGSSSLKPLVVQAIDISKIVDDETKIAEPFTDVEQISPIEVSPVVEGTEDKVAAEVEKVFNAISERHKVPKANIFVVGSSGLADRLGDRSIKRKEIVEEKINTKLGIKMEWISSEDEARMEFRGVLAKVPDGYRSLRFSQVLFLDIGSGNIKGAYVTQLKPLKFEAFDFGLGTKSFADEVRKTMAEGDDFLKKSEEFRKTVLLEKMRKATSVHPGLQNLSRVYLAGGAPYGMTVLMHPDVYASRKSFVELPGSAIGDFHKKATSNLQALLEPSLKGVPQKNKEDIQKQVKTITTKIFSGDQVISAAQLLYSLDKELALSKKAIFFSKDALFAWPRGYLAQKILEKAK